MSSPADNKRIVIIAGPNGAGKTTFAREFLPTDAELPNFVNARFDRRWLITLRT
jgi:predicted ABC-type ATPase